MGSSSPRVELPVCFPRRLRAVLALRQQSIESLIARLEVSGYSRPQLTQMFARRTRADEALIAKLKASLDAASWSFVMGETDKLDALAQERAAGLAA